MRPHIDMTPEERKAYMEYRRNNKLTPDESKAYIDYLSELEDRYGCDVSPIPIDGLEEKTDDEIWEMMLQKREERRKRNAAKAETA